MGSREERAGLTVEEAIRLLARRGVALEAVARMAFELQLPYHPDLTLEEALESVRRVLTKREVQHALLTGITLDCLAEEGKLPEPLGSLIREGDSLYGVDKVLALSVVNVYGSIGLSNFGYLARSRPGFLGSLVAATGEVHTFLDDLAAALVAAACARIAHRRGERRPGAPTSGEEPPG